MSESTERLLGSGEVAAIFRVDSKTVSRWAREGKLRPPIRTVGGHYRYRESNIAALMRGQEPDGLAALIAEARTAGATYIAIDFADYDRDGHVTALLHDDQGVTVYESAPTIREALTAAVARLAGGVK